MRKDKEPKKTITYTVAECSEFHELGEYHENVKNVSEAKRLFGRIDPRRMNGIPAIGIKIHTEGTPDYEDMQWDFYVGNRIELDMLEYLPQGTEPEQGQAGQVAESSEIKERYCAVQISMLFRFWNNMEVLRAGGSERGGRFDRRGQGVTSSVGLFTNTTSE